MPRKDFRIATVTCSSYLPITGQRECFTRNKRDFMFQVWPKLNFDARKDYESGLEIFNKNFSEKIADDDMGGDDAEAGCGEEA